MLNELVDSTKDTENTMSHNEIITTEVQSDAQSQKEKYAKKIEVNKQIINTLIEKFPLCFGKDEAVKPLKLGIFQDITENEEILALYSKTNLRAAIRYYTMSWRYLDAVAKGGDRIDLTGEKAGAVDTQQQEHAATQLAEAKAKVKSRFHTKKMTSQTQKTKNPKKENKFPSAKKHKEPHQTHQNKETKIAKIETPSVQKPKMPQKPVDQNNIEIGKKVNVLIGQSYSQAEIIEINKDNVRVTLPTGLTLNVKINNLSE